MTAVAPDRVNHDTGEVLDAIVAATPFNGRDYLSRVRGKDALQLQAGLAAAYDEACAALIGPNDVQVDKGRTFKKKSAWRKLARHFTISVEAAPEDSRFERFPDGSWVAYARAVAVAPWGQRFTDVGACASDEEIGRRVITMADAIATAFTRASNRAISNLVAMGEVSAEEIGERRSAPEQQDGPPDDLPTSTTRWPGPGKMNGKPVTEWTKPGLQWLTMQTKGPHIEVWVELAKDELKRRDSVPAEAAK